MPVAMMLCLLVLSVVADLWTDRIPNALTLCGLVAGLINSYERAGIPGLVSAITAAAVICLICFLLFMIKALRGGDGKLLSALAAMTGLAVAKNVLILSLLIALIAGLPAAVKTRFRGQTRIHFSVPVLLATLIIMI